MEEMRIYLANYHARKEFKQMQEASNLKDATEGRKNLMEASHA
jgi:hypothetical protein